MHRAFTNYLWSSIKNIFDAILRHPFIKGLVNGNLEEARFKFYVIQDSLYLSEYARVLSLAAAKAPSDDWFLAFNEHAKLALVAERSLHESFFKEWGLSVEQINAIPMMPTNLAYTSYLRAVALSAPFHDTLAALLPCYWIYWEVGKELEKQGSKNPIYQRWIETYSSKEFGGICEVVIEIVEQASKSLTVEQKENMKKHFTTTSRYEYLFWDASYNMEHWPL
ncbi:MAG: thiaminase II [Nitrososphaerales archaeon]